jgi:general stress protein 26
METADFSQIQAELLRRISQGVYCTMATVYRQGRPRSRIVHPVWEGSTAWVISRRASPKVAHLVQNPHASLAYIQDKDQPVYADCTTVLVDDLVEKHRFWDYLQSVPPPMGFDPGLFFSGITDPNFGLIRLTPWRVELYTLGSEPLIWRPDCAKGKP